MKKLAVSILAVAALIALPALAGEWHTGASNLCTDCHTMHFSQTHNWDGTTPVPTTPAPDGNWLGAAGPNHFLLKLPANQLCLACHDGQTFAPDVVEVDTNTGSTTQGRSAGALNQTSAGAPYETWKGHTLDSTATPPGFDPTKVGLAANWYDPTQGLECISCHLQHGTVGVYRNLGPRALGTANLPSYVIATTNDNTRDVWINIPTGYTANTGDATTFGPFYDNANISYNRFDETVGTTQTSNAIDTQCASCHGNFHGGTGNTEIGGVAGLGEFIRHPTSGINIGSLGGGHSALSQYVAATSKVKVYADDRTAWTDAAPGCVSCHKAHGNQNPFGLVFLSRFATSVDEQGGIGTEAPPPAGAPAYARGYRNLCGQCHRQGP